MADSLALDPQTSAQLQAIITTQSAKAPQDQDWTGMYQLISNFIQANPSSGFNAGITYFFSNAGDTNGQNPDAPSNFFIRTYYKAAAQLQGVTLTDQQIQAVSGNIGSAIANTIAQAGVVDFKIDSYVDDDVRQAVIVAPGLSMATWAASLFAETKLGYTGFYQKYFTTDQDWSIFYGTAESTCLQTAAAFPGQVGQGTEECANVFAAASSFYLLKQQQAEGNSGTLLFNFLLNAGQAAIDWLSDALYPATSTAPAEQHAGDLSIIGAITGANVDGNQFVVGLQGADGRTGTLSTDLATGTSLLLYGANQLTLAGSQPTSISQNGQGGLIFGLGTSQSGTSRAVLVDALTDTASIEFAGVPAITVPAGGQISINNQTITAQMSENGWTTDYSLSSVSASVAVTLTSNDGTMSFSLGINPFGQLQINSATFDGQTFAGGNFPDWLTTAQVAIDDADSSFSRSNVSTELTSDFSDIANGVVTGLDSGIGSLVALAQLLDEDTQIANYLGLRLGEGDISQKWVEAFIGAPPSSVLSPILFASLGFSDPGITQLQQQITNLSNTLLPSIIVVQILDPRTLEPPLFRLFSISTVTA